MLPIDPLPLKEEKNVYKLPHRKPAHDASTPHNIHCYIHKPMRDFKDLMEYVGFSLRYVKSGANGHTFYASCADGTKCAIKIVPYSKSKKSDIDDPTNPVNVEILMLRLLSQYITNERCPHVIAPIITFNTPITSFIDYISSNNIHYYNKFSREVKPLREQPSYMQFLKNYSNNYYHDTLSVLVSEWADKGDFLDYLKENYLSFTETTWKVLFFQIVVMLACIHQNFPDFKHNDLKANNILVTSNKSPYKSYKYLIHDKYYLIPNIGCTIKFWDFDFSSITSVIDNKKLEYSWAADLNITPTRCRYYDLHYFFNSLPHFFTPLKEKTDEIPDSVYAFISRVVPPGKMLPCKVKKEVVQRQKPVIKEYPISKLDPTTGKFITVVQKKQVMKTVTETKSKPTYRLSARVEFTYPQFLLMNDEFFAEFRVPC